MSQTAIENQVITTNLLQVANDTGWTIDGVIATHSSCNAGTLHLTAYTITPGVTYTITYEVLSISGGSVQFTLGGNNGAAITTAGFVTQTIVAGSGDTYFFSNANCQITIFNLQINPVPITNYQQNTIAFSERTGKWGAWYTMVPDIGDSLFVRLYTFNQGRGYFHESNSNQRGNLFGIQYPATVIFSTNQQPTIAKTFIGINYQSNKLVVTPSAGIATSANQLSELIAQDFVQQQYNDGSVAYEVEGLYQTSFLRDMNVDIINGPQLKGNWLTIGLQSPSGVLNLFSTEILYVHSYQSIR